jgi:hypothetical protein
MKIVCLDRDNCGESFYIQEEDLKTFDFSKKFHKCKFCNKIAILVKDDFFFDEEKINHNFLNMYFKLMNKE